MNREGLLRLARFGAVGGAGAVVHMTAFEGVRSLTGVDNTVSWCVSFLVAATAAWAMNRRFTFTHAKADASTGEWLRYIIVAATGAAAHLATFTACVAWTGFFAAYPALAIVPGSLASLCVTYAGASLFVFPTARSRP